MAVKLQVAEHLAAAGDHDAVAEISEVRRLTRQALSEVRDIVSGYRQPMINAELAGARIAPEVSGITLHLRDHHGALIPQVEATCGWIIREATTNVIRRSRARNRHISLERDAGCPAAGSPADSTDARGRLVGSRVRLGSQQLPDWRNCPGQDRARSLCCMR
jgi:two-component system sensor histidine kinase DesK